MRCSQRTYAIEEPCHVMPASPARPTTVVKDGAKRFGASRQRPGAPRHDSISMAVPSISEGERIGALVQQPNGRWPQGYSEGHDRGTGAQTADCALAFRDNRRNTRGYPT